MPPRCPRCGIPLKVTGIDWVSSCARCGGLFAARIVGPLGERVVAVAEAASQGATMRAGTAARVSCPVCMKVTTRESFRSIDVDRCGDHGIWFDRDEVLHLMKGTKPATLQGLGAVAAAGVASAAAMSAGAPTSRANEDGTLETMGTVIDLADVGLNVAAPVIEASIEAADTAAWMLVDIVAGLFDE